MEKSSYKFLVLFGFEVDASDAFKATNKAKHNLKPFKEREKVDCWRCIKIEKGNQDL